MEWYSTKEYLPPFNLKVLVVSYFGEMEVKYIPEEREGQPKDRWYPSGLPVQNTSFWAFLPDLPDGFDKVRK